MYEALYRKYRPRSFDDVAGQEHITETLKRQVQSGRLSHAYLFIGTRGTGKTTCARILARAVNCEHPVNGNPCNCCASCRGIEEGSILDVTELDAASNNGVDDVRMLRDEAIFSPTTVKKRVYIIDEVHMLSKPAFNALLKILEEPPEHLMFILATTELNKVLPTILSRCQRHSFRRLDADVVAKRLAWVAGEEGIALTADAAQLLGRLADGGMRDGLSLLDQCASREQVDTETVLSAMGLAGALRTVELAERIVEQDTAAALELFRQLWQNGKDPASLLGELAGFFRDVLMLRLAPRDGMAMLSGLYTKDSFGKITLGSAELLAVLNLIQKYQAGLRDVSNTRLQCELCLIELCGVRAVQPGFVPPVQPVQQQTVPAAPAAAPAAAVPVPKETAEELPPPPDDRDAPPAAAEKYAPPPAEPVSEPEAPKKEAPSAAAGNWEEVLRRLEKALPAGTYSLLTDEYTVKGRVEGSALILSVHAGFHMDMINQLGIKETISRVSGLQVQIREMEMPTAINDDKLGMLGQFKNVTIQ